MCRFSLGHYTLIQLNHCTPNHAAGEDGVDIRRQLLQCDFLLQLAEVRFPLQRQAIPHGGFDYQWLFHRVDAQQVNVAQNEGKYASLKLTARGQAAAGDAGVVAQ